MSFNLESGPIVIPQATSTRPRVAVILAAGDGSRMKGRGVMLPKPLLKVGGMHLIERTILTLRDAGIERFRVVLGTEGNQIAEKFQTLRTLRNLNIEAIRCTDHQLGNGASLRAGAKDLDEPFVVTMADHILGVDMVKELIEASTADPLVPHLLVDPNIDQVFDLDDATKVRSENGSIKAIHKELTIYDVIDTGVFHFPAGAGRLIDQAVNAGGHSVSDIVAGFMDRGRFGIIKATNPFWQDVDTPEMAKEAEAVLLQKLPSKNDGPISKHMNRPISMRISRHLAHWRVSPNLITTLVTAIGLVGAFLVSSTSYVWILTGALIFQLASILDGCDGEVARFTFSRTRHGAWYDRLSDNARHVAFFTALGISGFNQTESQVYIWGIALMAMLYFYVATITPSWRKRLASPLRGLIGQDTIAFLALLFCAAGGSVLFFWVTIGVLFMVAAWLTPVIVKESITTATKPGHSR